MIEIPTALRNQALRLRWTAEERRWAAVYNLSWRRTAWRREWRACSSPDDLFDFAVAHLRIGQNRDEFLRFLAWAAARQPRTVLEIGVRYGGTSFMFANAFTSCRDIIGIDIRPQNTYLLRAFRPRWIRTRGTICGESSNARTVAKAKRHLGSASLDFLFIDGDHSYEGAAADFLTYRHLVRDGGVIAFHDICMDHGTRYGLETTSSSGEVYLLWRKLREAYEVQEFFASEDQDGAGIGALLYDPLRPLPTHVGRL